MSDGREVWRYVDQRDADGRLVGGLSADELSRIREKNLSHKMSSSYDEAHEAVFKESEARGAVDDNEKLSTLESEEIPAIMEQLKIAADEGMPGAKEVLEQFSESDKLISENERIIKALASCMLRG
jgi:hypothetical protein